uniref:Uncharacterized protein n=1 Tax=Lotus japonicus TaxID=34305 RepID=I3SVK1_LOTJA|nr:unknown [Lotus japonicus]
MLTQPSREPHRLLFLVMQALLGLRTLPFLNSPIPTKPFCF